MTFAVLWFVFKASTPENQSLFQSGWFVEGLLSQTLIVHMVRTRKIPFIQSHASTPLLASTLAVMAAGIWLPLSPLAAYFKMQPLPAAYFVWLAAILLAYLSLTQLAKHYYYKRYDWH